MEWTTNSDGTLTAEPEGSIFTIRRDSEGLYHLQVDGRAATGGSGHSTEGTYSTLEGVQRRAEEILAETR